MNNNINQVNFKGSFLINYKSCKPGLKKELETVIGKNGKMIFEKFNGNTDNTMYVLKDSKDKAVCEFIKLHDMDFKYFPEISTQHRFDTYFPEDLINYIQRTKPTIIINKNDLSVYLEKFGTKEYKNAKKENLKPIKILHALNVNLIGKPLKNEETGVTKIVDSSKGGVAIISPDKKKGGMYVYVKPNNYDNTLLVRLNKNYEIEQKYNTPEEITSFYKSFKETIRRYKQIKMDKAKNSI